MSRCGDPEVAKEVYTATLDERDRGWVRGPIPVSQIPEHSILTRRVGVIQSSTGEGGEQIRKVRPIDDYTQSLANLTASSCETIAPHGVDTIMAGLLLRLRLSRLTSSCRSLLRRWATPIYAFIILIPTKPKCTKPLYSLLGLALQYRHSVGRLRRCGISALPFYGCRGRFTLTITYYRAKPKNVVTLTSFKPGSSS